MRSSVLVIASAVTIAAGVVFGCSLYGGDDDSTPDLPDRAAETGPGDPVDAGGDTGVPDAPVEAATTCDAHAPFTSFTAIDVVNTPTDENQVHLSSDELTMYVSRAGAIAVFTRTSKTGAWTGGGALPHATAGGFDVPRVSDDTLRIYFSAYLGGGLNATRILITSRPTNTSEYGSNDYVDLGAPDTRADHAPFFLPDERTLYFTTNRGDAGVDEIFVARKGAGTSFQSPQSVTSLYSAAGDKRAVAPADESVIYFSSRRAPVPDGTWQIHAGYKTADGSYDVVAVPEISGSPISDPAWLSADLCRLYFMSDRAGGKGARDVWLASRTPQ